MKTIKQHPKTQRFNNAKGLLNSNGTLTSDNIKKENMNGTSRYAKMEKKTFSVLCSILLLGIFFIKSGEVWGQFPASGDHVNSGAGSWVVPAGVFEITIDAWGGGGAGGGVNCNDCRGAGGGAGGSKVSSTISVTPGETIYYSVAAQRNGCNSCNSNGDRLNGNDTWVNKAANAAPTSAANGALAKGGQGGQMKRTTSTGEGVGSTTGCVGNGTFYKGGNGRVGGSGPGGGGGSSAGSSADGNNSGSSSGASAPAGGGNGGNGRTSSSGNGNAGSAPGGGGGGAYSSNTNNRYGGAGAAGRIIITYTVCTPPSITTQPQNAVVCPGGTATFSVAASEGPYQWQWDTNNDGNYANVTAWCNASDYTTNTLTITDVQDDFCGLTGGVSIIKFRVVVGSGSCQTISNDVTLSIETPPAPFINSDVITSNDDFNPADDGLVKVIDGKNWQWNVAGPVTNFGYTNAAAFNNTDRFIWTHYNEEAAGVRFRLRPNVLNAGGAAQSKTISLQESVDGGSWTTIQDFSWNGVVASPITLGSADNANDYTYNYPLAPASRFVRIVMLNRGGSSGNFLIDNLSIIKGSVITQPTCDEANGTFQINSYDSDRTYTFTPSTGVSINGTGLVTAPEGSYTFTVDNEAGCTSPASTSIVVNAQPTTPAVPTISTVAATCSAEGTATVTNYDEALTYTFTPAGPTVGSGGVISNATAGTSYTVTAGNGSCTSAASSAFTRQAQLITPSVPTISTVAATCSAEGTATVTNYDGALTYTFTPTGPTVGAGGVISSATAGTSYTVTAGNGSCTSAASEAFTIEAQPQPATTIAGVEIPDEAYLWRGGSTGWTVASNWYRRTGGGYEVATVVPTTTRDVYIFPTASDACITSSIPRVNAPDLTARNVYIANDATLEFINTASLDVYGNFTNNGSLVNDNSTDELSGNRTIRFSGAAASQELNSGGTGANKSFANLEIDKSSGEVTLMGNDLRVTGDVFLRSGNLKLNQRVLDLGSTGKLVNESNDNYVYCDCPSAYIRSTGLINTADVAVDLGNLGLSITPSSDKPLGDVEIKRHHQRLIDEDGMPESITRYYDVKKNGGGAVDNNGELNANIKVAYLEHELVTISDEDLSIYRKPTGESSWLEYGGSVNTETQEVWFDNWDAFSLVTLSEFNSPLPVQFLGMELTCERGNEVIISWSTASENNSDYFEIERSRDGYTWTKAGQVPAAGNSSTQTNYSFTDTGVGPNFEGYYRLRQFDIDGQFELFPPLSLFCNEDKTGRVEIYPNPSDGKVNVFIYAEKGMEGQAVLEMTDAIGKRVQRQDITIQPGAALYPINFVDKQSGMYYLNITFANGEQLGAKLIKN